MLTCSSSTTMTPNLGPDYQVFLSFRGPDTRDGFTNDLFTALTDAGIYTFRDDEELRVGKEIGPELLRAINQSKISIPIFSKNYAHSKWCMRELTEMLRCTKERGQVILPIFFDVTPEVVKHQVGSFAAAFSDHKQNFEKDIVESWKQALNKVGGLKGWERSKIEKEHESGVLMQKVLSEVFIILKKNNVDGLSENLVGMDHHVEEMTKLLDVDRNDVRLIGIHGMGGIGKTTIAKVVFNKLSECFEQRCSFLKDVREMVKRDKYLDELKKQMVHDIIKRKYDLITMNKDTFYRMKVLIVFDDVDDKSQLETIFANLDWFGRGSRIIVTTRNKEVFNGYEACWIYKPKELDEPHSLQLFSKHAFKRDCPTEDYYDLSRKIVSFGGGLPLFLEIVGSLLFDKGMEFWESISMKLAKIPDGKVQEKLKISYDALELEQREIFLDISCHFIGMNKENAFYMWEDCGFFPGSAIEVLIRLFLVKVDEDSKLWMHDLIRDLGRDIVRRENPKVPGDRTRLWSRDDAIHTMRDCKATTSVETLSLSCHEDFPSEAFRKLSNVRYLHMDWVNLNGDFKGPLKKLRWLCWNYFPPEIKFTDTRLEKLVIFSISWSRISDNWEGWKQIKMATNLKVLDLTNCNELKATPDFSTFPNLERLNLEGCRGLVEISPSIAHLKQLSCFSIENCKSLRKLPQEFGSLEALKGVILNESGLLEIPVLEGSLQKLETLSAYCCFSLRHVSLIGLHSLTDLNLDRTDITELPNSIDLLVKLRRLSLKGCIKLTTLPDTIGKLVELQELDLYDCSSLIELPISFVMLEKLQVLDASQCKSLEGDLPVDIGRLSSLRIFKLWNTKISRIPSSICRLISLLNLDLGHCNYVQLPSEFQLSTRLVNLSIPLTSASLASVMSLLNLKNLQFIYACTELVHGHRDMRKLIRLERVLLANVNNIIFLPMKIDSLTQLKDLSVFRCKMMQCLPELPSSLISLSVEECELFQTLPDLSHLRYLSALNLSNCSALSEIRGLNGLESLTSLEVSNCGLLPKLEGLEHMKLLRKLEIIGCESLKVLSDLSNSKNLEKITVKGCPNLIEIKGLEALHTLQVLDVIGCASLERLPDLSNDKMLKQLILNKCEKLKEIKGIEALPSLKILNLSFCRSMESLPNLSSLKGLEELRIYECGKLMVDDTIVKSLKFFKNQTGCEFSYGKLLGPASTPQRFPTSLTGYSIILVGLIVLVISRMFYVKVGDNTFAK